MSAIIAEGGFATSGTRAHERGPTPRKAFLPTPKTQMNPAAILPTEEEWAAARAVSPLIDRIHESTIFVTCKLFADPLGRRRTLGALSFLAHLLCFSIVDQMSLFEGSEICDVAKIQIPNVLKMCKAKKANGWPWCYDTTTKYLNLLVAVGVLLTYDKQPGIYYLPLGAYVLLPKHAGKQIEKLATRRPKVRASAAFRQAAVIGTIHQAAPAFATALGGDAHGLVLDEQAAQVAIQEMYGIFQQEGFTPSPAMSVALLQVFGKHMPRLLRPKGSHRRFLALTTGETSTDSAMVADLPKRENGANLRPPLHISARESTIGENNEQESANKSSMVDSSLSDITLITLIPKVLPSDVVTESKSSFGSRESTIDCAEAEEIVDSQLPAAVIPPSHPLLAGPLSPAQLLTWRFSSEDHLDHAGMLCEDRVIDHLAGLLSQRYNHDNKKMRHYRRLIQEDLRSLDIAIIDASLRSEFPDPHHPPDKLGGGWITKKYKEHRAGIADPLPEVLAWANTTYSYDEIRAALERTANRQIIQNQPPHRPLPKDIIVDSDALPAFWTKGSAQALVNQGFLYVDLDGELLSCEDYEQWRESAIKEIRAIDQVDDFELLCDTRAYLEQRDLSSLCSPEEEAALLENLPAPLKSWLNVLETIIDPECEKLKITVAPVSRWRVIEVWNKQDKIVQRFRHAKEVEHFVHKRGVVL